MIKNNHGRITEKCKAEQNHCFMKDVFNRYKLSTPQSVCRG